MAKSVLIARPHPFIVTEMTPFLAQAGYNITKLNSLSYLRQQASSSAGTVISLAVTSSVNESAEDIFNHLYLNASRCPVVFAAMLPLNKVRTSIERIVQNAGMPATTLSVSLDNMNSVSLGKPETFLYISKDDLVDSHRRQIASHMIQRHFG